MNAALRDACKRAQDRLVERSAQTQLVERTVAVADDLLGSQRAAVLLAGRVACSECQAAAKPAELDGSGRCSECAS